MSVIFLIGFHGGKTRDFRGVFRATAIEAALSASFDAKSLDGISMPEDGLMQDIHASPAYRAHLIVEMARRAVAAC